MPSEAEAERAGTEEVEEQEKEVEAASDEDEDAAESGLFRALSKASPTLRSRRDDPSILLIGEPLLLRRLPEGWRLPRRDPIFDPLEIVERGRKRKNDFFLSLTFRQRKRGKRSFLSFLLDRARVHFCIASIQAHARISTFFPSRAHDGHKKKKARASSSESCCCCCVVVVGLFLWCCGGAQFAVLVPRSSSKTRNNKKLQQE